MYHPMNASEYSVVVAANVIADPEEPHSLSSVAPQAYVTSRWLTEAEAETLFRVAANAEAGCIVAVGSRRGEATYALCAGARSGAKLPVIAIDGQDDFVKGRGRPSGFVERASPFETPWAPAPIHPINSADAVRTRGWPVSVLLVADDRGDEFASDVLAAWRPRLRDGATVILRSSPEDAPDVSDESFTFRERVSSLAVFRFEGDAREIDARSARQLAARDCAHEDGDVLRPEKIGYHMYYGGGGTYLYQPIPKNACTTIKTLLLEVERLPVDDIPWHRHQKEYNGFPGTNHLPLKEQIDIFEGRTDTFKFVFVRNPFARLASCYADKIRMNAAPYMLRKLRSSARRQGVALSDPITFPEFVGVVCRQSLAEMDSHYRPQFYEGRFGLVKFDFVGRMEMLPTDLTYALERIGAAESVFAQAYQRNNETGSRIEHWETVPPDTRRLFLDTFEIDFDVLKYPHRVAGPTPVRHLRRGDGR